MDPGQWVSTAMAVGMFILAGGGTILSHGRHTQKVADLKADVDALEKRVNALEQIPATIAALGQNVEHLADRLVDSQKLYGSELGRLADQTSASHKLMEEKLGGFKELMASQMGELTDSVRAIRNSLDEQRSWAPAPARARQRPKTGSA